MDTTNSGVYTNCPPRRQVTPVYELRVFLSSDWLFFHFAIRSKFNCRN